MGTKVRVSLKAFAPLMTSTKYSRLTLARPTVLEKVQVTVTGTPERMVADSSVDCTAE